MLVLSTDSLEGYGINRIFKLAQEAGYDGIDLMIDPKNYDTQNADYIKELSDQYNLPVVAIQTPPNCSSKKVSIAVEMAKKLGTKIVVIQPPRLLEFKYIQWLKKEIPKIRAKESISIALENAPSGSFLGIIPEHAMNNLTELKKFKHACLDTTRVAQRKQDVIRVYGALRKFMVHMHLSNVRGSKLYCSPQKGILPLESLLSKMKQEDYQGAFSIKVKPHFLHAGDDEKVLEELNEIKKFYEKFFKMSDTASRSTDNKEDKKIETAPASPEGEQML